MFRGLRFDNDKSSSEPDMDLPAPSRLQQFALQVNQTRSLHLAYIQRRAEQVSNDPNDPRLWPSWQKACTYGTICLFSFMANINASAFTIAVVPLIRTLHISPTQATGLTAYLLLGFGFGNLFWVPLMRVVGKRPVYLLAMILLIATNAWSAKAASYGSLLASRVMSGIGAAAADATVPSVTGDLFGQHKRGMTTMIFSFALSSGIFLSPLINAWVIQLHGWRWVPGWMCIAFGFIFFLAIFFIHETEYRHRRILHSELDIPCRRPFLAWLSLTISLQPKGHRFNTLTRSLKDILIMSFYPAILYSAITIGLFVGWAVIIQITAGQILTQSPYSFSLGHVGLFHLSGWLGTLPAILAAGLLVDYVTRRNAQLHASARSPAEVRLRALMFPAIIAPTGLLVYGICLARRNAWIAPAFGYAMHSFGFSGVANILVTYSVDGYLQHAGEGLVSLFIIRNIIGMVCSFYSSTWIVKDGMPAVFGTMAALEWVFLLLAAPVYLWNNRLLEITRKFGPMKRVADERKREEERRLTLPLREQAQELRDDEVV